MHRACAHCGGEWLAGNTNTRAQCTEISIPKRHTYKHTYAKRHAKQDYAKALGNYILRTSPLQSATGNDMPRVDDRLRTYHNIC